MSQIELLPNNRYELTVAVHIPEDSDLEPLRVEKKTTFYSRLKPLYASVRLIRADVAGDLLSDLEDERIRLVAHENSVLADRIAESGCNPIDSEKPRYAARQFVLYKTRYDLMLKMYLEIASSSSTRVADFKLQRYTSQSIAELSDILDQLKDEYEKWKAELLGDKGRPSPLYTLKGGRGDPYPYDSRRVDPPPHPHKRLISDRKSAYGDH